MIKLYKNGTYLLNGKEIVEDCNEIKDILSNKVGGKFKGIQLPMEF